MKLLLLTLLLLAGTVCTTSTVLTPDGKTLLCMTCCTNGACITTCS